jgi:hypothetical protein
MEVHSPSVTPSAHPDSKATIVAKQVLFCKIFCNMNSTGIKRTNKILVIKSSERETVNTGLSRENKRQECSTQYQVMKTKSH